MNAIDKNVGVFDVGRTVIFYINRDQDINRRLNIEAQLGAARTRACRISAVQGRLVPSDLESYFFAGSDTSSALSAGEIGCYASHLKAAREIVARELPYALVLEDDAIFPSSLQDDLDEIVARAPQDWDVVHLSNNPSFAYRPLSRLCGHRQIVRYSRVPAGAIGYLISNRGARKLLAPGIRAWPIDTDFRQPWCFDLKVFGVVPKLIAHNDALGSALLEYGERSRRRRGLRRPSLQNPFGNPLHTPQGAWFNMLALGPVWWVRCATSNLLKRLVRGKSTPKSIHSGVPMFGSTSVASSK